MLLAQPTTVQVVGFEFEFVLFAVPAAIANTIGIEKKYATGVAIVATAKDGKDVKKHSIAMCNAIQMELGDQEAITIAIEFFYKEGGKDVAIAAKANNI